MLTLPNCPHLHILSKDHLHFFVISRKRAMEEAYKTLRGLCQGVLASEEDRKELRMEALTEKQEEREREEDDMEYDSGDDLALEDDVEVVIIEYVGRESKREEEGSRGQIGGNNSEGDSEGNSKRDCAGEKKRKSEGEGKRRADEEVDGDAEGKKRRVSWMVDVEQDEKN